ncbi:MAG: ASCH domain-containing protein [Candidatus Binatia bacterium]
MTMAKALSIRQPWAELILQGRKNIEVRTWATRHRGELWLHAGTRHDSRALLRFNLTDNDLTFGALVGKCEIYSCVEFTAETWDRWRVQHLNEGSLNERRYAWFIRNPVRITPKRLKGRLGLMQIDTPDKGIL